MVQKRSIRLATLDDVSAEVDRLHRSGYLKAGNWSLSQVCEHLADWMSYPMDGFPKMPFAVKILLGAMRTFRGKALLKKFIEDQSMAPGQPTAPESIHPDTGNDAASVERLQATIRRLEEHRGTIHPSPLFGALTRQELIALQMAHCNHHLGFLVPKESS
jgi:Protein of unknown function (DUF1569)